MIGITIEKRLLRVNGIYFYVVDNYLISAG